MIFNRFYFLIYWLNYSKVLAYKVSTGQYLQEDNVPADGHVDSHYQLSKKWFRLENTTHTTKHSQLQSN